MPRSCPHCGGSHSRREKRCPKTGKPLTEKQDLVGETIAGRYYMVRLLGDGGMGSVYKAADQVLRRFVAIKMLHPTVARNQNSVDRFEREARAAASIGHPNIIEILDFGTTDSRHYMVMEYLKGRSLSQTLAVDGAMPMERACRIASHTLAGLASAHSRGILHRDLKPANLMLVVHLGDRDFVKICDFGFAALVGAGRYDTRELTPERTLVGTPAYAAPERLRGDDRRDPRIDVYSVGVVLYEMLAGRRPFDAPTFRELARKVRKEEPPSLRTFRPDVPPLLEEAVMRALAKKSRDRWPNTEAMAQALVPFGGHNIVEDDNDADSFTMEMMRIKGRLGTMTGMMQSDRSQAAIADSFPQPAARPAPAAPVPSAPVPSARAAQAPPAQAPPTQAPPMQAAPMQAAPMQRPAPPPMKPSPPIPPRKPAAPDPARARQAARLPMPVARKSVPPRPLPPRPRPDAAMVGARPQRPIPDRAYAGRLVNPLLRYVARKFGDAALPRLLAELKTEERAVLESGIASDDWIDRDTVIRLVEKIDARLGDDDLLLVVDAGRALAEGTFDLFLRDQQASPPPELVLSAFPQVMSQVVRGFSYEVRRVGRGYGRIELVETGETSLAMPISSLGFVERCLERFGGEDVEVNMISARALGDDLTLIDASWFA